MQKAVEQGEHYKKRVKRLLGNTEAFRTVVKGCESQNDGHKEAKKMDLQRCRGEHQQESVMQNAQEKI